MDHYYPSDRSMSCAGAHERNIRRRAGTWRNLQPDSMLSQGRSAPTGDFGTAKHNWRRLIFVRAILLWEQQRYGEALPYARSAAVTFSNRRETQRYFEAKEVEALILHRQGDVAAACETYQQMFMYADELGDDEMKARSARNLGIAYRDRAEVGLASRYMLIALRLYEQLDQHAIVLLMRGLLARLALTAGNASEAAHKLPELIDEMRSLGMRTDAARAQLDLAEAFLILGRLKEVEEVCSGLAAFFREAQMLTGALTAAAYCKEAAAMRRLTMTHIERVRAYFAQLERAPRLSLRPPLRARIGSKETLRLWFSSGNRRSNHAKNSWSKTRLRSGLRGLGFSARTTAARATHHIHSEFSSG